MSASTSTAPRILIAEHDHQLRGLLETMLHLEGYEVDGTATLEEAFEKVDQNLYSLVLTDLFTSTTQPQLDAARQLQQRCRPTPVGIVTGWRIDQGEVKRGGFAFAIQKPFDIDDVLQRIADHLNTSFTPEEYQQTQIIRRALQALSQGDWETLRILCTPTLCYYPLTRSVFTRERAIIGIDAYLAYAQLVRQRLPGFQINQMVIFQHPKGLIARYMTSWQGQNGERQHITSSAICRFRGDRISQIGVAQPRERLRALLEKGQNQTSE